MFVYVPASRGRSNASFREERLAVPSPNAMSLQTTTVALRRGTTRNNSRSIVDHGLIRGGPHRRRNAVCLCPAMPWDMPYVENFLQSATTFISLDLVALPGRVYSDTITQSMMGTVLVCHHIPVNTFLSTITLTGTDYRQLWHRLLGGNLHYVPTRGGLGECWATPCFVDRLAQHAAHRGGQ